MKSQAPSNEDTCAMTAVSHSAGDQTVGSDALMRPGVTRITLNMTCNDYHPDVEGGRTEKSGYTSNMGCVSPFELTTTKLWTSAGRAQATIRGSLEGRMALTEVRRTRGQEEGLRTSQPYSFNQRDVHWSQSTSKDVRMPVTTSDFIKRMTPREQPRIEQDQGFRTTTA